MIHQFRDKRNITRRKIITQISIWVVVFAVLSVGVLLSTSSKLLNLLGRPVWSAQKLTVGAVDGTADLIRTKSSVIRENDKLKSDNSALTAAMIDYQILKDENESLKAILGRVALKHNFTLAYILAKPDLSPYDTVIVDAGEKVGVSVGQSVYADGDVPVGEVTKVYGNTSLVSLYSNPGKVTNAFMASSNNSVEIVGRGGGNFDMRIPQEVVVNTGDMVVTTSSKTVSSEVIAIVEGVTSSPSDPYKDVLLRSPVNIQDIKYLQIEK
jgi:rod shape-determining protein MreC